MRDGKSKTLEVTLGDLADQNKSDEEAGNGNYDEGDNGDNGGNGESSGNGESGDSGDSGNTWYWHGQGPNGGQMRIFRNFQMPKAYLGVELQGLTDQLGGYFGVKDGKGALISRVVDGSPADEAGLKAGDVITKIGDEVVEDPSDVTEQISNAEPGDSVNVTYLGDRGHNENTVTVKLAKPPAGQKQMMLGNGDLPNIYLMPGMRQHMRRMQGMQGMQGMNVAPRANQALRQQMQELRDQMRQLRDQLEELRDQMHEEKGDNR
jgi:hypothetical protein